MLRLFHAWEVGGFNVLDVVIVFPPKSGVSNAYGAVVLFAEKDVHLPQRRSLVVLAGELNAVVKRVIGKPGSIRELRTVLSPDAVG